MSGFILGNSILIAILAALIAIGLVSIFSDDDSQNREDKKA